MKYSTFELEAVTCPNTEVREGRDGSISWHAFGFSTLEAGSLNYMEDTYALIRKYATPEPAPGINLDSFRDYCAKYGSPFGSFKNNTLSKQAFITAFTQINTMINWEGPLTIDDICISLSASIQSHYNEYFNDLTYWTLTYDPEQSDNQIIWTPTFEPLKKMMFPIFQISIDRPKDMTIINSKSKIERTKWLKSKLLENCSRLMDCYFENFSIEMRDGFPTTKALITNHLTIFLFKKLTDQIEFNICPYCKEITPNGKKYCNKKHMDSYRQSVPECKLSDLFSHWRARSNRKNCIPFYDQLFKEGKQLIDMQKYDDVVKYLRQKRREFERE